MHGPTKKTIWQAFGEVMVKYILADRQTDLLRFVSDGLSRSRESYNCGTMYLYLRKHTQCRDCHQDFRKELEETDRLGRFTR